MGGAWGVAPVRGPPVFTLDDDLQNHKFTKNALIVHIEHQFLGESTFRPCTCIHKCIAIGISWTMYDVEGMIRG